MSQAARMSDESELRLIEASEWARQRWGWLESVRRDPTLNDNAKMVAHCLVLDFCNTETMRCDPSYRQISDIKGGSPDTAKRGVQALVQAGWIISKRGAGRGNYSVYAFLTRAKILPMKGGKFAPQKGCKSAQFSASQKGANLHGKGGKSALVHNIDKPWNNHRAASGDKTPRIQTNRDGQKSKTKGSMNPMVQRTAARAVASWREGRKSAFSDLQQWELDHIVAAELLTEEELASAGICNEGERHD